MTTIDFNSDSGEGFGAWRLVDDDALLASVSSANVACGFHGGDPSVMRRVCASAAERGVNIGAHVGYRDLAGFGRRSIDVPPTCWRMTLCTSWAPCRRLLTQQERALHTSSHTALCTTGL